ncbi:MAG: ribonuclease P protein component [Elusimicrobia bacterium]|nr:ribonuclease P protein component [Elusimicrobiota bacterium]
MNDFSLPKKCRITRKNDFSGLLRTGKRVVLGELVLWWEVSPQKHLSQRLGILVSKKITGGAVERNRAKRCIREVFRLNRHKLPEGADIMLSPKAGFKPVFCEAEKAVINIWQKAGLIK